MSDQDDEPTRKRGASEDDWDDEPMSSKADDDWDDEPAPRAASTERPADDDDWDDEWDDGDRPKRDMTLVYAVVAATIVIVLAIVLTQNDGESTSDPAAVAPVASPSATEPETPDKVWQGAVGEELGEGAAQMEERATSGPGIYIWTDFCGWHVRNNGTQEITVMVTADKVRVKEAEGCIEDEAPGELTTEASFTVAPGDGTSGEGFDLADAEAAIVAVTVDGEPVDPAEIKLGGGEGVASENPVSFRKE